MNGGRRYTNWNQRIQTNWDNCSIEQSETIRFHETETTFSKEYFLEQKPLTGPEVVVFPNLTHFSRASTCFCNLSNQVPDKSWATVRRDNVRSCRRRMEPMEVSTIRCRGTCTTREKIFSEKVSKQMPRWSSYPGHLEVMLGPWLAGTYPRFYKKKHKNSAINTDVKIYKATMIEPIENSQKNTEVWLLLTLVRPFRHYVSCERLPISEY